MADEDAKNVAESSDGNEKTASSDGNEKTGKGGPSEDQFSAEQQKSFDAGLAKGATKGAREEQEKILGALGVKSVDEAKTLLGKAKETEEKARESMTAHERAIDDLRKEYETREQKLKSDWEPVIEDMRKVLDERDETTAFETVGVKDPETMRAFMKLWPAEEGEALVDHVKRIAKKKDGLVEEKKKKALPKTPGEEQATPEGRMAKLAARVRGYYGSKRLDDIAKQSQ